MLLKAVELNSEYKVTKLVEISDGVDDNKNIERLFKAYNKNLEKNGNIKKWIVLEIAVNDGNDWVLELIDGKIVRCTKENGYYLKKITESINNGEYVLGQNNDDIITIEYLLKINIDRRVKNEKRYEVKKNWRTITEMFEALNATCNWLIIRNHEFITDSHIFKSDEDIDILCDDLDKLVSVIGAKKRIGGRCSYYVEVDGRKINLDIRFVGDKYFDPIWQKEMLDRKVRVGAIPMLCNYDYFFSLLYHIKLQKKYIKEEYKLRVKGLAEKINLNGLENGILENDLLCSRYINAFLKTHNYRYTYTDNAVRNEKFLKYIERFEINDPLENWRTLMKKLPIVLMERIKNKIVPRDMNEVEK